MTPAVTRVPVSELKREHEEAAFVFGLHWGVCRSKDDIKGCAKCDDLDAIVHYAWLRLEAAERELAEAAA